MSKGTPITTLRIPPKTKEAILAFLRKRAENPLKPPLSMTEFILEAIAEKLDHVERSKRSAEKRRKQRKGEQLLNETPGDDLAGMPEPPL